ncbi:MAG: hypothetical protein S4CHLAM20_01500 [Chlamydiia bacterium]|nr:hypothetical protein [Chlamydiia bacterium]
MSKIFNTGSMKELWLVSYPMMVNFLSLSAMLFIDRIFLSWYSEKAMSASVTSGTLSWAFICGVMTLAAMSEVFVAQYNGAKKFKEIGKPVWQMIWLCLFSFALFIPIALFVSPYVFPADTQPLENSYFQFFMYTGPFFCINSAIAGFFIGRGYPKLIQWMAVISNVINIILDPILIFGIGGLIPSFGMMGAAYATLTGTLVQAGVVFYVFWKKKYDKEFGTRDYRFDKKVFKACLKIGAPPAVFIMIELIGWTMFYVMMRGISDQHIFVAGICQSILILFFFVGWGLEKGCVALGGNFIGQKRPELLKRVLKSSMGILAIFGALLAVFFLVFSEPLVEWFFHSPLAASENTSGITMSPEVMTETKLLIQTSLYLIFFYLLLESIRMALNGLLTAAGDTMFLLIAGTVSLWLFYFVPTYFIVYLPKGSILTAYVIQIIYAVLAALIVYARFAKGTWKKKTLIEEESSSEQISTIENFPRNPFHSTVDKQPTNATQDDTTHE